MDAAAPPEAGPDAETTPPDGGDAGQPMDTGTLPDASPRDAGAAPLCAFSTESVPGYEAEPLEFCAVYLKAPRPSAGDQFGASLAMSGELLVVGAPFEDGAATGVDGDDEDEGAADSGAVYVYLQTDEGYVLEAYLKASNTGAGDRFGSSVSLHGDTLIVGAPGEDSAAAGVDGDEDDDAAEDSGAAYVFVRDGERWSQAAYLKASNPGAGDAFGTSVAVHADGFVVGAPYEDGAGTGIDPESDESAPDSGAAYVFFRRGSAFEPAHTIKASNCEAGDVFGSSVALSAQHIVVGAPGEDSGASAPDGDQTDNSSPYDGAAYAFAIDDATEIAQSGYLKSLGETFGRSVAIEGDLIVIGVPERDSNFGDIIDRYPDTGNVSAFVFTAGSWEEEPLSFGLSEDSYQYIGTSVALADGVVVTGGPGRAPDGIGYVRSSFLAEGSWKRDQTVYPPGPRSMAIQFGVSVATANGWIAVGAPLEDGGSAGPAADPSVLGLDDSGAVYVLHR